LTVPIHQLPFGQTKQAVYVSLNKLMYMFCSQEKQHTYM